MQITSRSGWGALPPESTTTWNVANLDGICQHWFGSPTAAADHAGCDDLLRSVQRSHQAGEFSDIAYNFGVCPHGTAFELRGWNVKTGANGTPDANSRFLAIVYMAGTGDPLTALAKVTLRDLYAEAFNRGVALTMHRHGEFVSTSCPGPELTNWLATGAWKPLPKVRFVLKDGEGHQLAQSAAVEVGFATEKARLSAFFDNNVGSILRELRDDRDAVLKRVKA